MDDVKASPFWTFSLGIYRLPGIPAACLTLQDRHGVDVNVMLYALWLSGQGRALATADITEIITAMAPWKTNVVVALRGVRRVLRDHREATGIAASAFAEEAVQKLRDRIKSVELEAERLQQEALCALKPPQAWGQPAAPAAAAAQNIDAYAQALGAEFDPAARQAMLDGVRQVQP